MTIALAILAFFFIARYKEKAHTLLYREGIRNENDGHYTLALQDYEDALSEIRKQKADDKFGYDISERIRVLRTFVDYEKSFQPSRPAH